MQLHTKPIDVGLRLYTRNSYQRAQKFKWQSKFVATYFIKVFTLKMYRVEDQTFGVVIKRNDFLDKSGDKNIENEECSATEILDILGHKLSPFYNEEWIVFSHRPPFSG